MPKIPSYHELEQRISELETIEIKGKQVLQELRERSHFFEAIVNNAGFGIAIADKNRTFIMVNERMTELLCMSKDELIGKSHTDITHPQDIELSKERLKSLFQGKIDSYRIEKRYIRKDGNNIWVDLSVSNIRDNNGDIKASIGMIADITARRHAEKALLQERNKLQKALSEIKTLRGILPICSYCKKIRNDEGYWDQIESYIRDHSEAEFSHSICQECAKKLYSGMDLYNED
jgi:PAS domain S-box-containing protein